MLWRRNLMGVFVDKWQRENPVSYMVEIFA